MKLYIVNYNTVLRGTRLVQAATKEEATCIAVDDSHMKKCELYSEIVTIESVRELKGDNILVAK